MLVCPFCGLILVLVRDISFRFCCTACAYVQPIRTPLHLNHNTAQFNKAAGETNGGAPPPLEGGQKTAIRCSNSNCDSNSAFFVQIQMRSADEPPTTFYKCDVCGSQWRQD